MEIIVVAIKIYADLSINEEQDLLNYQLLRGSSREAKIVWKIAHDFSQKFSPLLIKSAIVKACVIVTHGSTEAETTLAGIVTIPDDIQFSLFDDSLEEMKSTFSKSLTGLPKEIEEIKLSASGSVTDIQTSEFKLPEAIKPSNLAHKLVKSLGHMTQEEDFSITVFENTNIDISIPATPSPSLETDSHAIVARINYVDDDSRFASIRRDDCLGKDIMMFNSSDRDTLVDIQKGYSNAEFIVRIVDQTKNGSNFVKTYELEKIKSFQLPINDCIGHQ